VVSHKKIKEEDAGSFCVIGSEFFRFLFVE
jgi:hypothetical protein